MKKKIFKITLIILSIALIYLMFINLNTVNVKKDSGEDLKADGVELNFSSFNSKNEKSISIKSKESYKLSENEVKLVDVEGHVFRGKGEEKDIIFNSKSGVFNKDFSEFTINGNAYIRSDKIELKSEEFKLHQKRVLTNKLNTFFISDKVQGNALKGVYFDFNKLFYNFEQVKGVLEQANKNYSFKTEKLSLQRNEHLAVLQGNAEIESKDFFLSANRINNFLDNENKKLQKTSCHDNCVVKFLRNGTTINCKSNIVVVVYNEQGRATEIMFRGEAYAEILEEKSKSEIESEIIKISLDGKSGEIKDIFTPEKALIKQYGEKKFKLEGLRTRTYFKEGKISKFDSNKRTFFKNEDYTMSSWGLEYDVWTEKIILSVNVEVKNKSTVFFSQEFLIDTKYKVLASKFDTKALIMPDKVKNNHIVKNDEIIINCKSMKVDDLKGEYNFYKAVLSQVGMNWYGKIITINKDNSIYSEGLSNLFIENIDNKSLTIKGEKISYISSLNQLTAQGRAKFIIKEKEVKSTYLVGDYISMFLNQQGGLKTIEAEGNDNFLSAFNKGNINGSALNIRWTPTLNRVILSGNAQVSKSKGWNTKGRMLEIDMKKDTIIAISEEGKRTETVY